MSTGRIEPNRRPNTPVTAAPAAAPVAPAGESRSEHSSAPASGESGFTAARPPSSPAPIASPADVVAARRNAKYAEYDRLLKDGKLDVTIGVGYDETGADNYAWSQIQRSLLGQGFRLDRVNEDGVHIYKQKVQIEGRDIDVQVNAFHGRNTEGPRDKFVEAMGSSEIVIYAGHARYGSGPDFDDKHDNSGNYFIDRGYTSATKPKNLYEGANNSGIRDTDKTKEYQMMLMFGCSTKHYEPAIRRLLKGSKDLDLISTQQVAYWNDLPKGVDMFLKGLKASKPIDEILGEMNDKIKGEDPKQALFSGNGFQDNRYQPGMDIPRVAGVEDVLEGRATLGIERDAAGKLVYNHLAERAQKLLMKAGIPLGKNSHADSDGYFGPMTEAAVRAFQEREGLTASGTIDAATMRKLEGYSEFR
jgi:hypothetical protein